MTTRNIKIILSAFIAICIFATAVFYGPSLLAKRDLNKICSISNTYLPLLENADDPVENIVAYSEAIRSETFHPGIKKFLKVLSVADNSVRTEIIKKASAELGYSEWDCPSFKKIHIR
ncbi:MAG: hypothetical protein IT287_06175 [Bdellovibrionaceae bacterium]|nr:hypothetical protein [Pseudobdellovibrionaceae bacterium]